jgi:hypothetical protein
MNSHEHYFSGTPFGHKIVEEARVHDEPYGYEFGDDVRIYYIDNFLAF